MAGSLLAQDSKSWQPPPPPHCDSFSLQSLPHLDFEQKSCYYRSQLLTGSAIFGAAFFGSIALARHNPPEWPEGAKGLGYQVGTRYAQGMVKSTTTFLVGAMLHEDPRPMAPYDRACKAHQHPPHSNGWARLGTSLLRVVGTHNDNDETCTDRIAFSRLAGSLSSGFVQLAWLPPSHNTIGNAFEGSASALGGYAANSVFTEFKGDLFGWLGKTFGTGKPAQ
jgi:hypothetical protein